jgi:hypothetical protein
MSGFASWTIMVKILSDFVNSVLRKRSLDFATSCLGGSIFQEEAAFLAAEEPVAWEIELWRAIGWDEGKGPGDKGGREAGNFVLTKKFGERGALESGGEFADFWEKKAVLWIEEVEVSQENGNDFLAFAGGFGGFRQGGNGVAITEDVAQEREGFVAEAVAGEGEFAVGGVVAVGEFVAGRVVVDFAPSRGEERAQEGEGLVIDCDFALRLHSLEPGGPAQEVEEDALGLVLGVVGEEDAGDAGSAGDLGEKVVAGMARGGFERLAGFLREGGNVAFLRGEGEMMSRGKFVHEGGVGFGVFASELMIEVDEVEIFEAFL